MCFLLKSNYHPVITTTPPASPIVWQIELHNGVDNRLAKALINDALKPALQFVEREWRKERAEGKSKNDNVGAAALVIVGRLDQDKFFSNGTHIFLDARAGYSSPLWLGLDYSKAIRDPSFFPGGCTRVTSFPPRLFKLHSDLRSTPTAAAHIPK